MSSVHSSSEMEGVEPLMEAAARLRGSSEGPSRKPFKPTTTMTKSQGVNGGLQKIGDLDSEGATPRLVDNAGRPPLSVPLPENPSGVSLGDQSGPTSLNLSLAGGSKDMGRTYNSFGGLHDMVSAVTAITVPVSPPPPAPTGGAVPGGRLSFASGSYASAGGGRGSMTSMRSPSRLGSPAMSPRSPLVKRGSLASPAVSAKGSRRSQLQPLLSSDLAQPQEVVKFKAEVKNLTQPPASVVQLAGDLQEKFDRVNRKLKNWDLIETAATERFNAAMDTALEALFSRINLAWPSGDVPAAGASDASTGPPSTSAYDSVRSRAHSHSKGGGGGRPEPAQRGRPGSSSRRIDDADDAGYGSPSSSASQRYAWDEELSTTDAEEDASNGSSRHRGGSRGSQAYNAAAARAGGGGVARGRRYAPPREAPPGSSGDPQASARTDAEGGGKGRHTHHQHSDVAPGHPPCGAPHPWHVGPNGTFLTGGAPPAHHPAQAQAAASGAAPPAFGAGFPVPSATAMFGLLQPPYNIPSSTAYPAPMGAAAAFQIPLGAPKGGAGAGGGQQPADNAWKLPCADALGGPGFPFASSGLWTQMYRGSAAPTDSAYGLPSAAGMTDSNTLLFGNEQGLGASTGRHAPAAAASASSELCATASTGALHSGGAWRAPSGHSTAAAQAALHGGAQESSASGPAAMPAGHGFDMADLRAALYSSLPFKPAYSYAPGVAGPGPQGLAFAGLSDLMGAAAMHGIAHVPGGHTVTYGAAGPLGHGHGAGQFFR